MIKVLTVLGTRPEIIKMSLVLNEFDKVFRHVVVHTGQNYDYELNKIFFNDLKIRKPNYFLQSKSDTAIKTISIILDKIEKILKKKNQMLLLYMGILILVFLLTLQKGIKFPSFILRQEIGVLMKMYQKK